MSQEHSPATSHLTAAQIEAVFVTTSPSYPDCYVIDKDDFAQIKALAISVVSETPRSNTEQDTYLGALISEYANVNFDAGAWDEDSDEVYDTVNEKCHEAKRKLLAEIARIRTSVPSAIREINALGFLKPLIAKNSGTSFPMQLDHDLPEGVVEIRDRNGLVLGRIINVG